MFCKFCKKEQEYVRVGGKTHCASCGGVLEDTMIPSQIKTPKIEQSSNGIETEVLPHTETTVPADIQKLAEELPVPAKTKEELEGSAILLDILSDSATDIKNEEGIKKDEKIIEASSSAIDYLATVSDKNLQNTKPKVLNDLTPSKVVKRDDYLDKYFKGAVKKTEDAVVRDVKNIEEPIENQRGAVKESTALEMGLLIVLIGITVTALAFLARYFI